MSGYSQARALIFAVPISVGLGGCFGYLPGENVYWDARVDELCQKDGGITIFETVELPTAEYERYLRGGELWLPSAFGPNATRPDPIYARRTLTSLRTGNPHVTKSTLSIVRGSDHKVLATRIAYSRDLRVPSWGPSRHDRHACPKVPDAAFFSQVIKERRTQ
jgi:hypothetical protein